MEGYKLVPMPGLQIKHYKGFVIEWFESQQAYRVYRPEENKTIAYVDTIREGMIGIDDNEWRYEA